MNRKGRALIIGASGGIGTAVAGALLSDGHNVLGVDIREARLSRQSGYAHILANPAVHEGMQRVLTHELISSVQYIINVAGGAVEGETRASPLEFAGNLLDQTFESNFSTSTAAIAIAVQIAHGAKGGDKDMSITLCSSINAIGNYRYPLYSASKAATESLVASMCIPLGSLGIRINCVRLGTVVTEASLSLHGKSNDVKSNDAHYSPLLDLTAIKRFVGAEEAARAFVMMATAVAATGTVLTLDWGQSIPGVR
jgi:NAD(P)-dependent dehydrogenase (short-subunit alcohol dehydrogenase family)